MSFRKHCQTLRSHMHAKMLSIFQLLHVSAVSSPPTCSACFHTALSGVRRSPPAGPRPPSPALPPPAPLSSASWPGGPPSAGRTRWSVLQLEAAQGFGWTQRLFSSWKIDSSQRKVTIWFIYFISYVIKNQSSISTCVVPVPVPVRF